MQEKNINSENIQELLDYSFKLLLIDVLFNNKEITKKEYELILKIIKKEHIDYLNKQLK